MEGDRVLDYIEMKIRKQFRVRPLYPLFTTVFHALLGPIFRQHIH